MTGDEAQAMVRRDNLRGSILMVSGMAGFAFEDMFIKRLSAGMSVALILLLLGLGGVAVFGLLAAREGRSILSRRFFAPPVLIRSLGELVGSIGLVMALALTPISSASAILQAAPLLVTMGAALFLGERVGWRRWAAIGAGFAGVLMIVQPGTSGFMPASLFAVLGVVALAARDLVTRIAPRDVSTLQLAAWGYAALIPAGLILAATGQELRLPTGREWMIFSVTLGLGTVSYYAITLAMRIGEIGVVAPFRYSRLIFALILGHLVFGERPDALMLAGAALVIGSGLYAFARERVRARRPSQNGAKPL